MALADAEPHIATLLDLCAARQAGITTYPRGERSKPAYLNYSEFRALATQKADLLRLYEDVVPGSIVLIHFQSHLENIIWFWASIIAGCVPALSTPLVNNSEGRVSHFRHLHRLLLDPIVITRQELVSSDFAENNILRVVAVEAVERLRRPNSEAAAQTQTNGSAQILPIGHPNGLTNGYTDNLPNGNTNGLANSLSNGLIYDHTHEHLNVSMNGAVNGLSKAHTNSHTNGAICSTKGVAVLMLTSGSTGNAKAVCLTHKQILTAIRGKLSGMPLPQGSALLNWIALDHVASLVENHLCAMFAGLDQVHVPAVEMLENPLLFLRLLSEHRVSRTFAPNFFLSKLQSVLDTASARDTLGIDLRGLLYIASGGEPNNVDTCARVTEHLVKLGVPNKNIVTPGFGMTETCAGAIFNRNCPNIDIQAGSEFAALGTCVPGIDMRVSPIPHADSVATITNGPSSTEGALEIRGPIVFEKYFNNDEATGDAFTADGWFKTGDLATIDASGNLKLVGRSKELIIINGVKYLPHELEVAIDQARITGVTQSFVVCFAHRPSGSNAEEIYVVYQHDYNSIDSEARMEALHSIIRTVVLFAGARPRVLPLASGWLDKTTLGKLSRTKIQASLAQGQYKDQEDLNARMLQSYRDAHFSEPRDNIERTLMTVFLDALGHDTLQMGIDTPVLDTGVSSIDLIRLKRASEKAFDIADIPIITIMTNTTIRSLATAIKKIHTSQYEAEYNPVVTLQCSGSKTPLWLIHPGIGEILVFLGLVQYFPDRPVYALRTRGFNPGEEPFNGLAEVVTTYYRALKKQQPHGPYAIAGYSYGSMLAFEISKILEESNDAVQFLGSFNLPPHIKDRMRMLDWTAGILHIAHFCGIITEQRSEELVNELRELPQPEQVAKLLAESDQQRCAELALTHKSLLNWTNVAWSLQKIGWEYDPSGSVSHMDIFYCQPLKVVARTRDEYRKTKLNHWADFVRDDVKFHEVDGEHYTMIGPDHVLKFQQTLKKALAARGL
ncbi:MAG: hypothetical protein Q9164_000279 [Protoblastenia rupestris]